MTGVPIMPLNVEEFFGSPEVEDMTGEQAAMWLLLIAECWRRKTLLPADDRKLARALGVNIRRWRAVYKPVFEPLLSKVDSAVIRQSLGEFNQIAKVNTVWDQVAKRISKNKQALATARAEKAAKSTKEASAAEPKKPPAAEPKPEPSAEPAKAHHQNQDIKGGPPPVTRPGVAAFYGDRPFEVEPPFRKPNGNGSEPAADGAPSLEGGLPPLPIQTPQEAPEASEPIAEVEPEPLPPPTPELLRSKLVRGKGLMAIFDEEEPDANP